jgi:two-component system response regulator RegX3
MRILVASARADLAERLEGALDCTVERIAPAGLLQRLARGGMDLAVIDGRAEGATALCEEARAAHRLLPLVVVTAADDAVARVRALSAGADEALSDAWPPSQVAARFSALERRAALVPKDPERICADDCEIDLDRAEARRGNRTIRLSAREVDLVRWLARHGGRAVSREELLREVFGVAPEIETRSVDVAMAALRKKIERDPAKPVLIVAVRGMGYAWGPGI